MVPTVHGCDEGGSSVGGGGTRSNMFGLKCIVWFELGIEGKAFIDQEEEDWGGKVEFDFHEKGRIISSC